MNNNSGYHSNKKIGLLFVCLGNICRSPAAEGIMQQLVNNDGLAEKFHIDSAGTGGWHEGELPDSRMRAHGAKRGYNFCSRARKFSSTDFDEFHYIVVMDDNNYTNVMSMALTSEERKKVHRMMDFAQKHTHYDHVPDPYYSGASGFELVLDLLEDACGGLLEGLKSDYSLE